MEKVGLGVLRHGGGEGVEACEEDHEVGLGVGIDAGDGVLELEQGVEELLFSGGHGLGITQIASALNPTLRLHGITRVFLRAGPRRIKGVAL